MCLIWISQKFSLRAQNIKKNQNENRKLSSITPINKITKELMNEGVV